MIIKSGESNKKIMKNMNIQEYRINSNFSGALISIDGEHGKITCMEENRIYFIIEGEGKVFMDNKEQTVSKNDVVYIPMKTQYNIIGKLQYFLVCSPEFNPDHDIYS